MRGVTAEEPAIAASFFDELRISLKLAVPIALAQLALVSMGLVDVAIVGRTTTVDLAAVSIGRSIMFTAMSVGMGVSFALEPIAAQAVGANDPDRAWSAMLATLRAITLVSLPLVLLAFAATLVLEPLGITPEIASRVRWYLVGHGPGLFAFLAFLTGKTFLQAHGSAAPTLVAAIVANLVNAVLCSVLVLGDDALAFMGAPRVGVPPLGALGAGLATSVGAFILAGVVFCFVLKYRPHAAPGLRFPARTIYRLGLPLGLQILAEIGVFSVVALLAGRLGAEVASAHQIALGLASFVFMGAIGISGATSVRVGHAVGAGLSPRRAGFAGLVLGGLLACAGVSLFLQMPRALTALFTDNAEVIEVGTALLGIAALFQLFDCLQAIAAGALRGAGDVRYPFVANVVAHWAIGFPLALLLGFSFGLGARGLWWGLTAGLIVVSAMLIHRFVKLTRTHIARV